ncbi:glycosyltransferase family 9 protein [Nitrospira sp. Kam-Ns4a]
MRALVLQLARLGDLVQTLPVLLALHRSGRARALDLLCPAPLRPLAEQAPGVSQVIAWDGLVWTWLAKHGGIAAAESVLQRLVSKPYEMVWNLNAHPRAILLAHLLGTQVIGPGAYGPLHRQLPPWAAYLRQVAAHRGANRIHLSDAWCGLCGVPPPGCAPTLPAPTVPLPRTLDRFLQGTGIRLALVVGAGAPSRRIPPRVWAALLTGWLTACSAGRAVLVGGAGEHEAGWAIQTALPPMLQSRLWNVVGRTDVRQLAAVLAQCAWVVGADTGPLHLGVALGAQALGFYIAGARVHETGPYGEGHWVWQAEPDSGAGGGPTAGAGGGPTADGKTRATEPLPPTSWPIAESVALLLNASASRRPPGWSLYRSRLDHLGVSFIQPDGVMEAEDPRARVWTTLRAASGGEARPAPLAPCPPEPASAPSTPRRNVHECTVVEYQP